jgi:hypothetical protein
MLVLWLLGRAVELSGQHRGYQPNTLRTRNVLSSVFIALHAWDDPRVRISTALLHAAAQDLCAIIESDAEEE